MSSCWRALRGTGGDQLSLLRSVLQGVRNGREGDRRLTSQLEEEGGGTRRATAMPLAACKTLGCVVVVTEQQAAQTSYP